MAACSWLADAGAVGKRGRRPLEHAVVPGCRRMGRSVGLLRRPRVACSLPRAKLAVDGRYDLAGAGRVELVSYEGEIGWGFCVSASAV